MIKRLCKIVATIGPASASPSMLRLLHESGADIFRLNMSHGEHDKLSVIVEAIRKIEAETATPLAIFADLQGPKIRTGAFPGGALKLKYGAQYRLEDVDKTAESGVIPLPHKELLSVLQKGDILKLDDGKLQLTISDVHDGTPIARADTPGELLSRKGVNLPGRKLPISALTKKDRGDLERPRIRPRPGR